MVYPLPFNQQHTSPLVATALYFLCLSAILKYIVSSIESFTFHQWHLPANQSKFSFELPQCPYFLNGYEFRQMVVLVWIGLANYRRI